MSYYLYLIKMLASEYEIKFALVSNAYLESLLITFGIPLFASLVVSRKNKNIDMVEALKDAA